MIMHYICFRLCYHISKKSAVFQSALLVALNATTEYIIVFMPYIGIIPNETLSMDPAQSFILTLTSKLLYLIGLMIISRIFCKNKNNIRPASTGLLSVPVLTTIVMILILNINIVSNLLSLVCLILIVMNIVVFATNQRLITTEVEKAALEAQKLKEKIDYDEYILLKETNRQTAVFNHDFKEHMNALSSLIGSDNEAAREYIKSIYGKVTQSRLTEYSDNKILNVILTKKKEECIQKSIKFFIDPIQASLVFISDMDIVTIFSNLINNAIESCMRSEDKKIYLNIHTQNDNFVVISVENTCDTKPIVINGGLKTYKDNAKLHGIGMNSIRRALKNYNGHLKWKYDEKEKIFSTIVVIKNE